MPLIIKDNIIDKISGPVSFVALKPKENLNIPFIILFGDAHNSTKGMCECKDDKCYRVYETNFLQILDSVSTYDRPVDFNIESWPVIDNCYKVYKPNFLQVENLTIINKKEPVKDENLILDFKKIAEENMYPIQMLRENLYVCYIKELRESDLWKKYCPTKLMRYHYVDVRQAENSKYNLEYRIHSIEQNLKIDEQIQPLSLSNLYFYKNLNPLYIENIITRTKRLYRDQYFVILKFKYLLTFNLEEAIEYFFNIATPENSLIMKQYSKLPENLKDENMWKDIFVKYFKYIFSKDTFQKIDLLNTTRKQFYEVLLRDDIDEIKSFHLSEEREILQYSMNSYQTSMYLDLYYLLRTLKGENMTSLSIGYFGYDHVTNLKYLLTAIMNFYDIIGEVKEEYDDKYDEHSYNRTLIMPNINLNDHLN